MYLDRSIKKYEILLNELITKKGKEQIHENVLAPCDAIVTDKGLDVLTISRLVSNSVASHLSSMRILKQNVYYQLMKYNPSGKTPLEISY